MTDQLPPYQDTKIFMCRECINSMAGKLEELTIGWLGSKTCGKCGKVVTQHGDGSIMRVRK